MKSRAAVQVEYGGPLEIEEIDIPDPGPNQVVVRNFASGVCYSQVHQLRDPAMPRPMALGHEGSGVVTQVGKEVTHVKEGDHVISTWVPRIPISGLPVSQSTGATRHGRPLIADGDVYTWSEHMVTFAEKVVPMSPSDPTDITCLVGCAVLTGAGAVLHTAKVSPGQSVRENKFPLGKLVTDRYSLEQIEEARAALEEGRILGRAIIEI